MLRWLKFSVVALVGCGFIGMIGYALWMRDAIRSAQLEPPLISAPDSPVKRRPESPGGMEIPNRDKLVFDLLDNSASVTAPAPAPADEAAENNDTSGAGNAAVAAETASTTTGQPVADVAAQMTPKAAKEEGNAAADQLALARLAAEGENTPAATVSPAAGVGLKTIKPSISATTVKVAPKVVAAKTVLTPAASTTAPVATAVAAAAAPQGFGVQVGAVGSETDAQRLAKTLQAKYPALKSLSLHTQSVASGSGTHVRVQFFGLADRAAAQKVCGQLGKQPCFPVGG